MNTNDLLTREKQSANIGISPANRESVSQMLYHLLADEHVLYLKTRNYHWNVTGMFFQPLHAFFQEQYTLLEARIDEVAERIRSLGFFAPGSMEEMKTFTRLEETSHLNGNAEQMLQNLLKDHEMIIQFLRRDLDLAVDTYNDAGTSDFLTALMEDHEKMAWMIRSHLT
jgi:starvation-inducible DNA-binding protein